MNNMNYCTLYDVFLSREIVIQNGKRNITAKQLQIKHPNAISHLLSGWTKHLQNRYILPQNKHLIFTCINQYGDEFHCLNAKSLFIQLNIPYNHNAAKYISSAKNNIAKSFIINGVRFCIKTNSLTQPPKIKQIKTPEELFIDGRKLKVRTSIFGRLANATKKQMFIKYQKANELLGCSIEYLMKHLESKFQDGMSWDNYGHNGWHIDHIKPCCSFDLTKEKEQKECFHYLNLQPLWAKDNYNKAKKERKLYS